MIFSRYAVTFVKPVAEVDKLAAFTAERTPAMLVSPFDSLGAGRACNTGRSGFPVIHG